ncbi:Uncharacterised protein [Mycobacteroides abscessus subsp. abscessus]|nr:Uncharacterised protein [Mycobacteroides abscessus subsp. abscessus]
MFPWSVMPTADMPSRSTSASIGLIFAAPSSIEYSVWLCRCTNEEFEELTRAFRTDPGLGRQSLEGSVYCEGPTDPGVSGVCRQAHRATRFTAVTNAPPATLRARPNPARN